MHSGAQHPDGILSPLGEEVSTMDVTVAVLADYANVSQDGKLNIMGIFQEINPPMLPGLAPKLPSAPKVALLH